MTDPHTKFTPDTEGNRTIVKPTTAKAAPADMSLMFSATASKSETFFTSPVASRTKTVGLLAKGTPYARRSTVIV